MQGRTKFLMTAEFGNLKLVNKKNKNETKQKENAQTIRTCIRNLSLLKTDFLPAFARMPRRFRLCKRKLRLTTFDIDL